MLTLTWREWGELITWFILERKVDVPRRREWLVTREFESVSLVGMLTISGTINIISGVTNPRHANVSKVARGIFQQTVIRFYSYLSWSRQTRKRWRKGDINPTIIFSHIMYITYHITYHIIISYYIYITYHIYYIHVIYITETMLIEKNFPNWQPIEPFYYREISGFLPNFMW